MMIWASCGAASSTKERGVAKIEMLDHALLHPGDMALVDVYSEPSLITQ